jgi:predicted site-specific integrase-resolvase
MEIENKRSEITPKLTPLEDWMDAEMVCLALNISKRTLEVWRYKGKIPYTKLNNKCFYKRSDIQEILDKNYKRNNN